MIENTGLKITSIEENQANWTRVNQKNTAERSIIDYVLMTDEMNKNTIKTETDEKGIYRLKGKEESDHNTIIIETNATFMNVSQKETILDMKDKKKWRNYNKSNIRL